MKRNLIIGIIFGVLIFGIIVFININEPKLSDDRYTTCELSPGCNGGFCHTSGC